MKAFYIITLIFLYNLNIINSQSSHSTDTNSLYTQQEISEIIVSLPACTNLTTPPNGSTDVNITTDLSWTEVADATGYKLTVGTSTGGTDILDNEDVGNVTTYDPGDFPCGTTIYVTIIPYNTEGDATGCPEESFTTEEVIADAGSDVEICSGTSTQLEASGGTTYSWSPATGLDDPNIYNPTASPTVTTTYTVTVSNDGRCPETDEMILTVDDPRTADAGNDGSICGEAVYTLNATTNGTGSWTGGAGTFADETNPGTTYTPEASEEGTSVTLTWTTSASGSCSAVSDEMILTVDEPRTAEAGSDLEVCGDNPASLNAATNGTGIWTGGIGTFGNTSNPSTTYTPHSSEVGNTVTLTWTTYASGTCSAVSDELEVTFGNENSADAGSDDSTCGTSSYSLNAQGGIGSWSGGNGSFANASSQSTTYTPHSNEVGTNVTLTWTTFAVGSCSAVSDDMILTVDEPRTADAGADGSICGETAYTLAAITNGTGEWTGGAGTFADKTNPGTTYTPEASEEGTSVTLTWTTSASGSCSAVSDDMILTVDESRTANAGADGSICGETAYTLAAITNGTGEWTGGAGTFADETVPGTTYTPDASEEGTSVTLTWTTFAVGSCSAVYDDMILTVDEPRTANAGSDLEVCGDNPASLNAATNGTGIWTGGIGTFGNSSSKSTTYTPHSSEVGKTVNLTWRTNSSGSCEEVSDDLELTIDIPRVADAGDNQQICGAKPITLNATSNDAGNWSGGKGIFDDISQANTSYTPSGNEIGKIVSLNWETKASGSCQSKKDEMLVTVFKNPKAEAELSSIFNPIYYGNNFDLLGSASDGTPPYTYEWALPLDTFNYSGELNQKDLKDVSIQPLGNEVYATAYFKTTDSNLCTSNKSIEIKSIAAGGCTSTCDIESKTYCKKEDITAKFELIPGESNGDINFNTIEASINGDDIDIPKQPNGEIQIPISKQNYGDNILEIYYETNTGCISNSTFKFTVFDALFTPNLSSDQTEICQNEPWYITLDNVKDGGKIVYKLNEGEDIEKNINTDNTATIEIIKTEIPGDLIFTLIKYISPDECEIGSINSTLSVNITENGTITGIIPIEEDKFLCEGEALDFNTENFSIKEKLNFIITSDIDAQNEVFRVEDIENLNTINTFSLELFGLNGWTEYKTDTEYYYHWELPSGGICYSPSETKTFQIYKIDKADLVLSDNSLCNNQHGVLALNKNFNNQINHIINWEIAEGVGAISKINKDSAYTYVNIQNGVDAGDYNLKYNDSLVYAGKTCFTSDSISFSIESDVSPNDVRILLWPGNFLGLEMTTEEAAKYCIQWGYNEIGSTLGEDKLINSTSTSDTMNTSIDNRFLFVDSSSIDLKTNFNENLKFIFWAEYWDGECNDPSSCKTRIYFNTDGIPPIALRKIDQNTRIIYPNPNNGNFNLKIEGLWIGKYTIKIFDMVGRKIKTIEETKLGATLNKRIEIPINNNGLMLLRLANEQGDIDNYKFFITK